MTYIVNLLDSIAIALECNILAQEGDFDAIRRLLCAENQDQDFS